jgi:GTP cyclohydrolase IA
MIYYSPEQFRNDCDSLARKIKDARLACKVIYGIPQGGIALAMELGRLLGKRVIDTKELPGWDKECVLVVDDVVDSGATINRFKDYVTAVIHLKVCDQKHFDFLPTFYCHQTTDDWIVYWWESTKEKSIQDNITRILQFIGEDPTRSGLLETPDRVIRSWGEIFAGYQQDPADVFKVFDEDGYNELVWMKNIEFYSQCEHHMLSFSGQAHVAYIANNEKVIGASKLARLVDIFARRLTTQERIAKSVTEALMTHLQPVGAACIIEGAHLCMRCRGVGKQNSIMGTSCLRGRFLEDSDAGRAARAELMGLIK